MELKGKENSITLLTKDNKEKEGKLNRMTQEMKMVPTESVKFNIQN